MKPTTRNIRAIPTDFDGVLFRSTLEAKIALLFTELGLDWLYESKRFHFADGSSYLPDFYLPSLNIWVEVKPENLLEELKDYPEKMEALGEKLEAVYRLETYALTWLQQDRTKLAAALAVARRSKRLDGRLDTTAAKAIAAKEAEDEEEFLRLLEERRKTFA